MTHFDVDSMGAWAVSFGSSRGRSRFKHKNMLQVAFIQQCFKKLPALNVASEKQSLALSPGLELSVQICITNALVAILAEILRRVLNALNALHRRSVQFYSSCACSY